MKGARRPGLKSIGDGTTSSSSRSFISSTGPKNGSGIVARMTAVRSSLILQSIFHALHPITRVKFGSPLSPPIYKAREHPLCPINVAVAEWSKAVDLSLALALKLYWIDPREFEPRPQQYQVFLLPSVMYSQSCCVRRSFIGTLDFARKNPDWPRTFCSYQRVDGILTLLCIY